MELGGRALLKSSLHLVPEVCCLVCSNSILTFVLAARHVLQLCIIFSNVVSTCCGIRWQSTFKIIITSPGARGLLPGVLQLLSHPRCPGSAVCTSPSERWFAKCSMHSGILWQSTLTVIVTTEAQHVLTWCQWLYCHVCSTVSHYVLAAWHVGVVFKKAVWHVGGVFRKAVWHVGVVFKKAVWHVGVVFKKAVWHVGVVFKKAVCDMCHVPGSLR